MPRILITTVDSPAELDLAMLIWAAANRTRPRPAGPQRIERVREKVAEGEVVLLAHYGARPAGMVLAEAFHEGDPDAPRDGVPGDGTGHLSMIAVDPAVWGSGVGARLVKEVQGLWPRLSVWIRTDNRRAERLFAGRGFTDIGNVSRLQDGEEIRQWIWEPAQTRESVIVEPFGTLAPLPGSLEETKPSPR
jgi:ribosomal protein S18 acetylase RimI-like enzyme